MSEDFFTVDLTEVDSADAFRSNYNKQQEQQKKERYLNELTQRALGNLRESGLTDATIVAARISGVKSQLDDYTIPYFDSQGLPVHGYTRTRVFRTPSPKNPKPPKYIQTSDQPTRLYFPPNFSACLRQEPNFLIFTEGEKKALSVAQFGFPVIGLGGVDSWRTTKLSIPADLISPGNVVPSTDKEGQTTKQIKDYILDISSSKDGDPFDPASLLKKLTSEIIIAPELEDIVKEIARSNEQRTIFIVYDTDKLKDGSLGTKPEVQQSAFTLAYWLLEQGLDDIRFVPLPANVNFGGQPEEKPKALPTKIGLDDFILEHGADNFRQWLLAPEDEYGNPIQHTFPIHPTIRYFAHQTLNVSKRLTRLQINKLARAIVADLDAKGTRYSARGPEYYYHDKVSRTLMKVAWGTNDLKDIRESAFGSLLISRYGIGTRDDAILKELGDQFVYIKGIKETKPRRVSYASDDAVYYQIDDGTIAKVVPGGISFHDNGHDNVLFLRGLVEPLFPQIDIRSKGGSAYFKKLAKEEWIDLDDLIKVGSNRWIEQLKKSNIQPMPGMGLDETHVLLSCHLYLAPWFRRWRNLMLPLELTQAEPSSGKSLFYQLRKGIYCGRYTLNRLPQDIRDWYANIIESDGMWVADNVGYMQGPNRQVYSDELARLITDLDPSVAMRKLFTTAEDQKFAADTHFAMTSIRMPFTNEDIIQRSLMIHMKAIPANKRNGNMLPLQLGPQKEGDHDNGGRQRWLINHWLVFQRFMSQVKDNWNMHYQSAHRLINYEQSIYHMGIALGYSSDYMRLLVTKFGISVQKNIAANNAAIKILYAYAEYNVKQGQNTFKIADLVNWMMVSDFSAPGKYLNSVQGWITYFGEHTYDIQQSAGITLCKDGEGICEIDRSFYVADK